MLVLGSNRQRLASNKLPKSPKDLEKRLLSLKLALHIYICQLSCIMNYVCYT